MSLQDNEIVFIPISDALYEKLVHHAAAAEQAPEEVVEAALAGELRLPRRRRSRRGTRLERFRASMLTRNPRSTPVQGVVVLDHGSRQIVRCTCCDGRCLQTFWWRGSMRCGCPNATIASGNS